MDKINSKFRKNNYKLTTMFISDIKTTDYQIACIVYNEANNIQLSTKQGIYIN